MSKETRKELLAVPTFTTTMFRPYLLGMPCIWVKNLSPFFFPYEAGLPVDLVWVTKEFPQSEYVSEMQQRLLRISEGTKED